MTVWMSKRTVGYSLAGLVLLASGATATVMWLGPPGSPKNGLAATSRPSSTPKNSSPVAAGPNQAIRVKTVRPVREALKREIVQQPAHVLAYEHADVFAKISGYLDKFGQVADGKGRMRDLDLGDYVQKDQILAELSVPEMKQEKQQKEALVRQAQEELKQAEATELAAKAQVQAARAKQAEAEAMVAKAEEEEFARKLEHERYELLYQKSTVTKEQLVEKLSWYRSSQAGRTAAQAGVESAKANVQVEEAKLVKAAADIKSAEARIEVAKANLQHTQAMLDYGIIRAPYAGQIARRHVHTGVFIQSAASGKPEPLFTILKVDRLRIVADIPSSEAIGVRIGQPVALQVNGLFERPRGTVVRLAKALDPSTRTLRIEAELESIPKALGPGMFGYVTITVVDDPGAVLLPISALLPGEKPAVLIVNSGKAVRQEMELGFSDGTRVQVVAGLNGNEEVVIPDTKTAIEPGQAVEIAK